MTAMARDAVGRQRSRMRGRRAPSQDAPRRKIGDLLLHGYTWLVIVWLCMPDRRHDRVQLQQPARPLQHRVGRLHHEILVEQAVRSSTTSPTRLQTSLVIAVLSTIDHLGARHDDRHRARQVPVPRPGCVQHAAVRGDLGTGDRHGRVAAVAVRDAADAGFGLRHDPHRAHHVLAVVRRGRRTGPGAHARSVDRGRRPGPRGQSVDDVPPGDVPDDLPGASCPGALLAFVLSIDDYVVTSFTNGNVTTFPLWIYGVSKLGMPPQVDVMGTLIFMVRHPDRRARTRSSRRARR